MSASFQTPLRYPGGKARLGAWIAWLLRHNEISGGSYIEPYAGGAGAALYLLNNQYVKRIFINDIDPVIYSFWWAVLNDTDTLLKLVRKTPVTVTSWKKQKNTLENHKNYSKTEVGFATFFLNRTNRSGILKGGIIGGLKQDGKYKIDARFNKVNLENRIRDVASQRKNITLTNLDALYFIDGISTEIEKKSLLYLDPPYFNKGSQLYRNFYEPSDHQKISKLIAKIKTPWIVTYDNCEEIRDIYEAYDSMEFSLIYSTSDTRPKATELMISNNITLPSTPFLSRTTRPYPRAWEKKYAT